MKSYKRHIDDNHRPWTFQIEEQSKIGLKTRKISSIFVHENGKISMKCPYCDKCFENDNSLIEHVTHSHKQGAPCSELKVITKYMNKSMSEEVMNIVTKCQKKSEKESLLNAEASNSSVKQNQSGLVLANFG